ncbi:Uncharacterised protein [Mycolicibacterium aichiense]|nr:Uncharacterised protein [Mycolicibacterium aichiense]
MNSDVGRATYAAPDITLTIPHGVYRYLIAFPDGFARVSDLA